jgi:FtsP/CotA-like multicopper oxidase with cupredoxin domain
LQKDTALVTANGGTTTWAFAANAPPGHWLLHCHNTVHMMGGMMTEVVYL